MLMSEWMKLLLQWVVTPLVITVLGTILIDYYRNKKNLRISCERLSTRLYKEKESDDVKISLSYKNEKVGDSLCVMTIRLTNTGRKDISFNQVFESEIELLLKTLKILDITIEKQSERVGAVINKKDSSRWFLSWGILKKKESIDLKIVGVFNTDRDKNKEVEIDLNDISFSFRGNNINEFDKVGTHYLRPLFYLILLLCVTVIGVIPLFFTTLSVRYDVVIDGVALQNVSIDYNAYTHLYRVVDDNRQTYKTESFDLIHVSQQVVRKTDIIVLSSVILIYVAFLIYFFILMRRNKNDILNSVLFKSFRLLFSEKKCK